ncbi:TPA: glutamate--tRNA ligase [Candidatus Dependentiae bacterium]|nr:MAG: Glutamate-tRNA ligase [candidate division TM6 bacterium GW2011_GWF2_36_131]KKQ02594.1 MAG: Glutamate-tRNA ligase [candidate division TM6 bacterium GW2011_GWE2_36_25]KKQ19089.1 MAG: Glutamate-tRNA ligase [candidate division TM6 bacterium GW2011_GWA2_36_9]HBR70179.1 glutamate--tRNA ligase [Candidatus Dependentiae bacterium]HCU00089.1 glutamate--tRNA ligase [Candidatus Dependentiae bacterium]
MNDVSKSNVKVRFAPSPTGNLHIGSVRAALFNWLFARHHKGTFLVRIEDTDLERSKQEFADSIISSLEWLGMQSDEPIIYQSNFTEKYRAYVEKLLSEGKAYKCYCSPEELEQRLGEGEKYDQRCRACSMPGDKPFVVRFRLPDDREVVTFHDLILGDITTPISQLDDFIIARSDGSPVYNFVVVIDDATMNITHVIRGQEHINNTPKQILLYEALGFSIPQFAHIPLILGKSGAKLSKRDAATSVLVYKEEGYLPEALINYLARLGWSHGDQEIFTIEELVRDFSLDGVGKSNATFDMEKLRWVNSEHIKKKTSAWLLNYVVQELDNHFLNKLDAWSSEQIVALIDLYKERVMTVRELYDALIALYNKPAVYNHEAVQQWINEDAKINLSLLIELLKNLTEWHEASLESTIKQFVKNREIKLASIAQPIRIALTGNITSPGIFHLLTILGKKESFSRIEALIK